MNKFNLFDYAWFVAESSRQEYINNFLTETAKKYEENNDFLWETVSQNEIADFVLKTSTRKYSVDELAELAFARANKNPDDISSDDDTILFYWEPFGWVSFDDTTEYWTFKKIQYFDLINIALSLKKHLPM